MSSLAFTVILWSLSGGKKVCFLSFPDKQGFEFFAFSTSDSQFIDLWSHQIVVGFLGLLQKWLHPSTLTVSQRCVISNTPIYLPVRTSLGAHPCTSSMWEKKVFITSIVFLAIEWSKNRNRNQSCYLLVA